MLQTLFCENTEIKTPANEMYSIIGQNWWNLTNYYWISILPNYICLNHSDMYIIVSFIAPESEYKQNEKQAQSNMCMSMLDLCPNATTTNQYEQTNLFLTSSFSNQSIVSISFRCHIKANYVYGNRCKSK